MALNYKVTLVTCLVVIVGFCWLVDRVARPIVELPAPPIVAMPQASGSGGARLVGDVRVPTRPTGAGERRAREAAPVFAHASPVEPPRRRGLRDADAGGGWLDGLFAAEEASAAEEAGGGGERPAGVEQARTPDAYAQALPPRVVVEEELVPVVRRTVEQSRPRGLLEARRAVRAAPEAEVSFEQYEVRKGDSLVKIMRRAWRTDDEVMLRALVHFNPELKGRENRIRIGETIRIPALSAAERIAQALRSGERPAAVAARKAAGSREGGSREDRVRWYVVQPRDSLIGIAREVLGDGSRWREIAELNELKDADVIVPGKRIKLPPAEAYAARAAR